jgi:microcystin-dependent protein
MDKTQFINFEEFSNNAVNGINTSDTFDTWRKKTNGIIEKLISVDSRIDPFYSNGIPSTLFIGEKQTITGVKTFESGTKKSPILKVGNAGIYNDGSGICIDFLKVDRLDNTGPNIKLGDINYILPTVNPSENSILIKSGNSLSWQSYNSIVDIVKQEGTTKILTVNEILPVGSIISQSISSAPTGWLQCSGERFKGEDYPDLAKALLNTYGKIYTTRTGNIEASSVRYNASWFYTLPNLNGRVLVGSGLGNDGTESKNFTIGSTGGKYNHGLITNELPVRSNKVVSSETGDLIYTLNPPNTTGPGTAHNNIQPYTSAFYIIKATKDAVVNTFVNRGNVLTFTKDGESIENIDMLTGGNTTINLNYDNTLVVNQSRELGIADRSISQDKLQINSVSPDKLSVGAPSWDSVTSALYEGSDPILRKRIATEEYVNELLRRKGPAVKLAEKYASSRYTSTGNNSDFCYITDIGTIVVNGDNTGNRFGYADKYGHTELHLPDNRKADKLYITYDSLIVLDTVGELWFMGQNRGNMFNCIPYSSSSKTWKKAFTPLYTYNGSTNKIKRVIVSSEPLQISTIAVIDTSNRLWIAGINRYGVNGNTTTISTSSKPNGETAPVLNGATVNDAILVGGDALNPGGAMQSYETILVITLDGKLRMAGYGYQRLRGDDSQSETNSAFNNNGIDIPDPQNPGQFINLTNCKLFASGQGMHQNAYLLTEDGSKLYAWGSGGLIGDGSTEIVGEPKLVWDAKNPTNNPLFEKIINKVYTTNSLAIAATYVLCQSYNVISQLSNTLSITGNSSTSAGRSVAISDDGNTIVFGGAITQTGSRVAVYKLVANQWQQYGNILSSPNSTRNESFGTCVAISGNGDRIAISSPSYDTGGNNGNVDNGLVRVYECLGNIWSQVGSDIIGDPKEQLGLYDGTLSLNYAGTVIAIGIPNYTQYTSSFINTDYGRVKIYTLTVDKVWVNHGNTSAGAGKISVSSRYDSFGYAIKLNSVGDRIAISAPGNNGNSPNSILRKYTNNFSYRRWWLRDYWGDNRGAIRVFRLNGTNWEQLGSTIYGQSREEIGRTLSFSGDGNRLAYSARLTSTNTVVRAHELINQNWTQIGSDINSETSQNEFGASICLNSDGSRIAIGAPNNISSLTGTTSGQVQIYGLMGNNWLRAANNIDGTSTVNEDFGASVYLNSNGTRVIVGSPGTNSVKVYNIDNNRELVTELWCIGNNTNGKFGGSQGSSTNNIFVETELSNNGFLISDFYCGNGYNRNTVNFIKAYKEENNKYYLFAAGQNSNFESGIGSNEQLNTFTEIDLSSDIIEKIIDIQSISNYRRDGKYTVLHLNDGRLYFAGHNKYMIDPNLPESYYRSNFTRIK